MPKPTGNDPAASPAVAEIDLPFPRRSGKVREVFDLGGVLDEHLLIVASDRISAFDCILPTPVPGKGVLLTQMALFWFQHFLPRVGNHVVTATVEQYPEALAPYAEQLRGRSMLVRKLQIVPFECVARGYLAGSGWKDYQATGKVCGIDLPAGLRNGDKLPEPIFTPATKAESGHDENVSVDVMADAIGGELAAFLKEQTLDLYRRAADYARGRGIILADTKLEWGLNRAGNRLLADEIFTPDSSRFWPADDYEPGREQASFDKQYVRNYLSGLDWDKTPPAPPLPPEIIDAALARYREAFERLTDGDVA